MKLLIDRRINTNDAGGIPETMALNFTDDLTLNFRVKLHNFTELSHADVMRRRHILAVYSEDFSFKETNKYIDDYERHTSQLCQTLQDHGIYDISLTRLPSEYNETELFLQMDEEVSKIRVRLDLRG